MIYKTKNSDIISNHFYDEHLKMVEYNSHETPNRYPSLNDQHFRLNKTSEVRDYSIGKIKERELMSKRFSNILLLLTILVTN